MRFLIFDIETIRDEPLWTPPAAENWQMVGVASGQGARLFEAFSGTVVPSARDHFAPPFAWRPIVIGFVLLEEAWGGPAGEDQQLNVLKVGTIEAPAEASPEDRERLILGRFSKAFSGNSPIGSPTTLVTWNGRRFDIPVIMLRSMRLGIPWPWYYTSRDTRYRFSEAGHCDLADAMADYGATQHLGLDGMARLIGLPGKHGPIDGAGVAEAFAAGRHAEIAAYCLADASQTAFLWLRWRLLKGEVAIEEYRNSAMELFAACEADERLREVAARADRRVLLLEEPLAADTGGAVA